LFDRHEINEIQFKDLERTKRIDSEFYSKGNILLQKKLESREYKYISDDYNVSDGNHLAVSSHFRDEGIPYYRGQDIYNFYIEKSNPIYIDNDFYYQPNMHRSHLSKGDVLLSIVGAIIGNVSLVTSSNQATCSCKLAILRPKNLNVVSEMLSMYIKTKYGQSQVQKFRRGTAQTGLILEDMSQIIVPEFSIEFKCLIREFVHEVHDDYAEAHKIYIDLEKKLLDYLNFKNPEESKLGISIRTYKESFENSGRFDSQYYLPKYDELLDLLDSHVCFELGNIVNVKKSIEPGSDEYVNEGIPFMRVANLSPEGITKTDKYLNEEKYGSLELMPKKDTILLSKDGTVGLAYKLEEDMSIITSSAILHLTIKEEFEILPDFLTLVLNSPIVRLQAERDAGGSIIKHWKPDEIKKVKIPILDYEVQTEMMLIKSKINSLKSSATKKFDSIINAIEVSIEQGEETGFDVLRSIRD